MIQPGQAGSLARLKIHCCAFMTSHFMGCSCAVWRASRRYTILVGEILISLQDALSETWIDPRRALWVSLPLMKVDNIQRP